MADVIIPGPVGRLEGRYHKAEDPTAPCAIVLHPHSLYGGTMNNKVTYHMYRSFVQQGFSVLRFNFRGVGRSEGEFDKGIGELSDAATTLDWIQRYNPDSTSFWIGGFSYGAWIGMQLLMRRPEVLGFISVAPPAGKFDFSFLSPCPASGLILQGDQDSVVDAEQVDKLAERLINQKNIAVEYHIVPGADHFFREKMDTLSSYLDDYIGKRLILDKMKPKPVKRDRRRRQRSSLEDAETS